MKPDIGKCNLLLDSGFSLVCVGENKVPNFAWKHLQTKPYTKDKFLTDYSYSGGNIKSNGDEIKPTSGIGIITGYNNLEVVDIDLKVLGSLKEQQDFWNEYLSFLKDNIDDFDDKFVIYKTVNNGYHILYRCSTIAGNQKIAKLKGSKEYIIETRGVGGYVFIYDNKVSKRAYQEICEVSEKDREVLFECSKFYNYIEETPDEVIQPLKVKAEYSNTENPVWQDYNEKTSMMDVVGDDFKIVRNLSNKYIIKRNGASSSHSGYIYKDSGCMYLFSENTIFPAQKLISPFYAYTIKHHNGDFAESAKDLYKKGFGSRIVKKVDVLEKKITVKSDDLLFPIDIFPTEIQNYIIKCNNTLDNSIDYMGCSLLWTLSVIVGNSIRIQVKRGWEEPASVWISVVGKAGIGKTPSISNIVYPLMKANNREIKKNIKESEKYNAYMALDKQDRQNTEKISKPKKTQFIVNDITLEALVEMHEENKNAVGVFKDELAGWFKDMNKYRAGSDLEFWLSSWSGKSVALNRKTSKSAFVEAPLIPVLGGIQPSILDTFYTEENKDNGFIDRMLLCFPDLNVEKYNDKEIEQEVIDWYSDYMISFFDGVKSHIVVYDNDNEIEPRVARFTPEAKTEWVRIFNDITNMQNDDEENEYMKSMLPKQKSYIPRFSLLINTISCFNSGLGFSKYTEITKESVLAAERLSRYFIAMAKKIKVNSNENNEIKKAIKINYTKSTFEKFQAIYSANPDVNKKELAEHLGISRKTLYEYIKRV